MTDCDNCKKVNRLNDDIKLLHDGVNAACVECAQYKIETMRLNAELSALKQKYNHLLHSSGWAMYGRNKGDKDA